MAKLPPISENPLTSDAGSEENPQQDRPPPPKTGQESRPRLPGLRDTLGHEIKVQRPIAPVPKRPPDLYVPGVTTCYWGDLPIKVYIIGDRYFSMQQPPNETRNEHIRYTAGGRTLKYKIEVVQQPEKARACGSGKQCRSTTSAYELPLTHDSRE